MKKFVAILVFIAAALHPTGANAKSLLEWGGGSTWQQRAPVPVMPSRPKPYVPNTSRVVNLPTTRTGQVAPFHPNLVNPSGLPGMGRFGQMGRTIYFHLEVPVGRTTPITTRSAIIPHPTINHNNHNQCSPTYEAPRITRFRYEPKYPLVVGQDPSGTGVMVYVNAVGGSKTNNCPSGAAQQRLTSIRIERIELAASSRFWITRDLAEIYPGAHIQGQYPLQPQIKSYHVGSNGSLMAHFSPVDPGYYEVHVRVCQADGQCTNHTYAVPVHLLEVGLVK